MYSAYVESSNKGGCGHPLLTSMKKQDVTLTFPKCRATASHRASLTDALWFTDEVFATVPGGSHLRHCSLQPLDSAGHCDAVDPGTSEEML